ncbi:protein D2-like isoform X2 [Plodia interpunctella]|uniref:protein D2-like isoform X2 n=1 Tax=Plodia interpunctella TaxID=58824 RepID=UPI002368001E|nr:protein D2-like isoform X2 [Plodia interpunctella]
MYLVRIFTSVAIILFECQYVPADICQSFMAHDLVPDIVSYPPKCSITFPSGGEVLEGKELPLSEVQGYPILWWGAKEGVYYTIMFCDADAPSSEAPVARSFLHWLKMNVIMDDVTTGDTVVELTNSYPEPDTGLHRYVFLVYEQPEKIRFLDAYPNSSCRGRMNFCPDEFAEKYNIGHPVAGNFYLTKNINISK